MSLSAARENPREQARIRDLLELIPRQGQTLLDAGAREGYLSRRLAERFERVTALDLEAPAIDHPRVTAVAGDITALDFPDRAFEVVLCAEVLEHIPAPGLERACRELARVTARALIIGVPYRQDLRLWRTTCRRCGGRNPPWGHVNRFDEDRLRTLFPDLHWQRVSYVGQGQSPTNALSAWLMDRAGNPYGTYVQDEPCLHCNGPLPPPPPRTLGQKIMTRLALWLYKITARFRAPGPAWIHVLLYRRG